jgi:glycosyltransferase involved in cell wall biosynthesis
VNEYVVIIPTRNRYELCLRAIRSVLAQTLPPEEVIVIDDASTDPRYEWLQEIANDARVVVLRDEVSSQDRTGAGFAVGSVRNRGLAYVRRAQFGGWVAFLDDDDEWLTEKMAIQSEAAKTYDDVRLFCSNAFNRTPSGLVVGYHHGDHGRRLDNRCHDVTRCLREFNPVICSSAVIHAETAAKVGWQQESGYGEDWDYWRRAAVVTPVFRIDEPLLFYSVNNPKEYTL